MAEEFDRYIKNAVLTRDHDKALRYEEAGESASLSFSILDHYAPLLYVLGAAQADDDVFVFNDACLLGSLSMTVI